MYSERARRRAEFVDEIVMSKFGAEERSFQSPTLTQKQFRLPSLSLQNTQSLAIFRYQSLNTDLTFFPLLTLFPFSRRAYCTNNTHNVNHRDNLT